VGGGREGLEVVFFILDFLVTEILRNQETSAD
jgi:hypothetical protein